MGVKRVSFKNSEGQILSARLESPEHQDAHNYAVFAHCFTCNKNLSAVRNIARALNSQGIAVLRFDFTGLGESEGDFSDTNFSSNVNDLVCASEFLAEEYKAPTLLIGHSLGGAAVIFAADKIRTVRAVATIGAPAAPDHVSHLFSSGIKEIEEKGVAEVSIGGRPFLVKKDFIDDLNRSNLPEILKKLKKPVLVAHSPQDKTVEIENAKKLYQYAMHPKSFISLDGADHLLTASKDSAYIGNVIAGWAERYLEIPAREVLKTGHQVAVGIGSEKYVSYIVSGKHSMIADEPASLGGKDYGPAPYEFVSAGLGSCTAITMKMYAERKEWPLEEVFVHVNHSKEENPETGQQDDVFEREIEIKGDLDEKQMLRMMQIADKCPVHKSLHKSATIRTRQKN